MSREKTKPSIDEILELKKRCQDIYSALFAQYEEDEKYYELEFRELLKMPVEFPNSGIVLPTARDMVDSCVDHTDLFNARVYTNRKGTSMASDEEAEMMRKFYHGIVYRTAVESSISPWRVGAKHYWLHGLCVLKTVWDADRWLDKPEQKEGESEENYAGRIDEWRAGSMLSLPVVIQAVNPHSIMPDPYEGGGRFVFEVSEKLVYDARKRYPSWSNPKGKGLYQQVECTSFWTDTYRCEFYDDEPVLRVKGGIAKHSYGFIPYVFIDTGLGNVDSKADPTKRYVGVLRYIRDVLISESRNYSNADLVLSKNVFPYGFLKGRNAKQVTEIDQRFGQWNILPEDVEPQEVAPQVPPQALAAHLDRTSNYITAHAAPNVVRGIGEQGVRAARDRMIMSSQASVRYQYATEAFKAGTAKALINCAKLMKNVVPGDIRVWTRTPTDEFDVEINKNKMKEPFTCYVEFAPISEEDEYTRHDDLERLVKSGLVTDEWAVTQMSNINPIDEKRRKMKKIIRTSPAYQTALNQIIAMALQEKLTEAGVPPPMPPQGQPTQGQPTQPPQGAGRQVIPPVPQTARPFSAEENQNNLAQRRSQAPVNPFQGAGGGGNR